SPAIRSQVGPMIESLAKFHEMIPQTQASVAEALRKSLRSQDLMNQINQNLAEVLKKSLPAQEMSQINQNLAEVLRKSLPTEDLMKQINQNLAEALSKSLPPPEQLAAMHQKILGGLKEYAHLYDTFGTPRDLIRISLQEQGAAIEEEEFNEEFEAALQQLQQQTGSSERVEGKAKTRAVYADVTGRIKSLFRGY